MLKPAIPSQLSNPKRLALACKHLIPMCYALSSQCTAHITGITGLKRISKKRRQNAPNRKKKKKQNNRNRGQTTQLRRKSLHREDSPSSHQSRSNSP